METTYESEVQQVLALVSEIEYGSHIQANVWHPDWLLIFWADGSARLVNFNTQALDILYETPSSYEQAFRDLIRVTEKSPGEIRLVVGKNPQTLTPLELATIARY